MKPIKASLIQKPDVAVKDILSEKLDTLKGIGAKRSALIARIGVSTIEDLLYFFPRRYEDRRNVTKISDLVPGRASVVFASVGQSERRTLHKRGFSLFSCRIADGTGTATVSWFNRKGLEYILKEGTEVALYGIPSIRSGNIEISNPEIEVLKDGSTGRFFTGIVPIYPSTAGLPARWFRHFTEGVMTEFLSCVKEPLPAWIIAKRALVPLADALQGMHRPQSEDNWKESRRRLVYEEFLLLQTGLSMRREIMKNAGSKACINAGGAIYQKFISSLPFNLTNAQQAVLDEIFADTESCRPMSRLLQGDVGSGKTIVAIAFAAAAADAGMQTVIMAPTEVLAEQIFSQAEQWLLPLGVGCVILKGGQSAAQRRAAAEMIITGAALAVVGTQALLQEKVKFKNLGAVIIDEQHRFGVTQRAAMLTKRKPAPHLLMMTATPIPRTLSLCLYGDLDISTIREKPEGRNKIETRLIDIRKIGLLMRFLADEIRAGGRGYWICPRVDDEQPLETASVERRYKYIEKHLGFMGAGILHGRMDSADKENAVNKFRKGEIKILVSTTVLEVGIDVPEATVVVIESPEHFGLSQLHQLRGRVGRGERRGLCVLLVSSLNEKICERFAVMLKSCDGFEIAEADLALRGPGELSGFSQHGAAEFKLADLNKDIKLLMQAKEDACEWILKDPELSESPAFKDKLKTQLGEALGIG